MNSKIAAKEASRPSFLGGANTQFLVFQMALIRGVNLFKFQKQNLCLDSKIVKYFSAQSLSILESLQKKNIIYRDIKPENFMIEFETGKLKLVDFGFAKELKEEPEKGILMKGRTFTKCGTPEYMAPEVINQSGVNKSRHQKELGYSFECDIWSWGVLICELIGGFNPFTSNCINKTFENILSNNINWPKNI